ncbi:MAG: hypothetical protein HQL84_09245 [Magnetococcales bacterium]|nr:hypothetical protein [Magnetococcales bacterium]MBF0150217.1 hypothetical protein [Magnetococcales bacterium]MBF0172549.1 hypothetical protein [Magnetococcales bacterium]MBF0347076.1 hypothetical protein [Magnetococcales bacterium]MBF0630002.1 hypothetical protein [Magnetococcales bacterium]
MGIMIMVPVGADAFCLVNDTNVSIHGQSLDRTAFEADIAPGGSVCCDDCLKNNQSIASLLVVTGYVPVSQNSQPGWNAECRTRVSAQGQVIITGTASQIFCIVGTSR